MDWNDRAAECRMGGCASPATNTPVADAAKVFVSVGCPQVLATHPTQGRGQFANRVAFISPRLALARSPRSTPAAWPPLGPVPLARGCAAAEKLQRTRNRCAARNGARRRRGLRIQAP